VAEERPPAPPERVKRKQRGRGGDRMTRGYARAEQRNQEAREALEPLAEVDGEKPKLPQVLAPALIMGVMSWGMWQARYWAVLGFQLILVFVIFSAFFGLVVGASSVGQILATLGLLVVAGTFFYFMVKAMARIQMPTRDPRE
jgi:hypothetical protein